MRFGGKGGDDGRCIALDSAKNVFVAGHFSGKVDFNPGTGISYLSSVGSRDIFAVKLDSGANFVWAGSMGGTGDEWLRGMTVDQFSNVLLTGYFSGTMDVDPSSVAYNLTSNGGYDSFLVKWTQPISLLASSSTSVSGNRLAETAARDTQVFPLRKSLEKETANLIDAVHAGQLDLLRRATLPDRDSLDLSVRDSLELIDWKSFDKFDWDSFELLS